MHNGTFGFAKQMASRLEEFRPNDFIVRALAAFVALQLVALAAIKGVIPSALNQDVAWMLYGGQVLLDGGTYGIDVVDPNPPLIFWVSAVVVAVARLFGTTAQLVYDLGVMGLIVASVTLCHLIYTRRAVSTHEGWLVSVLFAVAMVVPAGRDFGQRDHVTVVMIMPYLFVIGARLDGQQTPRGLQLCAGGLAGIGIALKPFFLLMWLVPEAYVVFHHGLRGIWHRHETMMILATQLLYAVVVVGFAPEYLQMAGQLLGYQDAYTSAIPINNPATKYLFLAIGLTLVLRPTTSNHELRRVLLLNVAVCTAILFIQAKGFRYHFVPVYVASLCLANVIVLGSRTTRAFGVSALRVPIGAVACVLVVLGSAATGLHTRNVLRYRNGTIEELQRAVETYAPSDPIFVVSPTVPPAFPLVNLSGVTWSSRYSCQWLIPASYSDEQRGASPFPYRQVPEMPARERLALDHLMEDLHTRTPALIVVPLDAVWPMTGAFDWLRYFEYEPRFVSFFDNYQHVGDVARYGLYARRAASAPGSR